MQSQLNLISNTQLIESQKHDLWEITQAIDSVQNDMKSIIEDIKNEFLKVEIVDEI